MNVFLREQFSFPPLCHSADVTKTPAAFGSATRPLRLATVPFGKAEMPANQTTVAVGELVFVAGVKPPSNPLIAMVILEPESAFESLQPTEVSAAIAARPRVHW